MKENEFAEFLLNMAPVYDRDVIASIRPADGWAGSITTGSIVSGPGYNSTLEAVRKLVEGLAYEPGLPENLFTSFR